LKILCDFFVTRLYTQPSFGKGAIEKVMPLYSYVASYRGGSYADQDSKSNFKGFASLVLGRMPSNAMPGLNSGLLRELIEKSQRAEWTAIPNRKNIWVMQIMLDGQPFTLHAVQTGA
jgi:hypothetical protein